MVLPSVMFGALHFWNGNGAAEGVLWAIWATALGIACADLTARTGNLGAAIGLHMANNVFALLKMMCPKRLKFSSGHCASSHCILFH